MATNIKSKRIVGKRCVAYGCGNTKKDGFTMHLFPKNEHYKKLWTDEVKKLRKDFIEPTAYSCLCSVHFTQEMFDPSCLLSNEFGIPKTMHLLKDAVPVITKSAVKRVAESKPKRSAAAKRQRKQVIKTTITTILCNYFLLWYLLPVFVI